MFTNEIYKFFADYIYSHSGIYYSEKDYYRLSGRLTTLMQELKVEKPEDLASKFRGTVDPRIHRLLLDLSTNNETYFLRDNKPFKVLTSVIIPEILKENPKAIIQIWSAGCSAGQEPYSILMSCLEAGINLDQIKIDATDISSKILEKAKSGNYTNLEVQRGLPITYLTKYFELQLNESWSIKPDLRQRISFNHLNLLTDNISQSKYSIVFCRNVLIYQEVKNRENILKKISNSLLPKGHLAMGSGESMLGMNLDFKLKMIDNCMFFQKGL